MAEERRELQEAGYATLGQAVVGHVMISVVIAPLVVGVLWLLGLIMQPGTGVGAIVVLGLVTTVASEVLMALGERPAVVRARHSAPGGWAYATRIFVVPPVAGPMSCGFSWCRRWWGSPTGGGNRPASRCRRPSPLSSCSGPLVCARSRGNGASARPRRAPSGKPRKR